MFTLRICRNASKMHEKDICTAKKYVANPEKMVIMLVQGHRDPSATSRRKGKEGEINEKDKGNLHNRTGK